MLIRINHTAVEFTLEAETTIGELTTSLHQWATAQNLFIVGILWDGRALGPLDETALSAVAAVDVETVPLAEQNLAGLGVVDQFFQMLILASRQKDSTVMAELGHEYPSVRPALETLFAPVFSRLTPALLVLDAPWKDEALLQQAAQSVVLEGQALCREIQDPVGAFSETLIKLERLLDGTAELPGYFQRGEDRSGFALILSVFTSLEDLNRRAGPAFRAKGAEPEAWKAIELEISPLLHEAETALSSRDFIFLTDLLEYELVPRLRGLRERIPDSLKLDPIPSVH